MKPLAIFAGPARARGQASRRDEGGFALLGAVMFILVLTILALSLFSLSGFEAQFMQDSMERAEVFYAAVGGLDRARFALESVTTLESVKDSLPPDGVVYAAAYQPPPDGVVPPDSTGPVDFNFDAPPVLVRVLAEKNGQRKFLEAQYKPAPGENFYKRLMVLSDPDRGLWTIDKNTYADTPVERELQHRMQTYLYGEVWQNVTEPSPDGPFIFPIGSGNGPEKPDGLWLRYGGVPEPDLESYFAQHWKEAVNADETMPGVSNKYDLDATVGLDSDSIAFFRTLHTGGDWSLDVSNTPKPHITVKGTAIWMLDRGVRARRTVWVQGTADPNDVNLLVIVAKPSLSDSRDPEAGVAFLGAMNAPADVGVVLISNGLVLVENREDAEDDFSSRVDYLTIFARSAHIMGPEGEDNPVKMWLQHLPIGHPADALLDRLFARGLLPNTRNRPRGRLTFQFGSWREVTE